ncbi:MAG TPA: hypothetical protein VLV84_05670 [Candidatus Acidoferrales bacterium]|nr:hypothetical protein [Candidatus Acidoferrales bacterium]
MTIAPFASTFVAIALIPVAFLFVHAFLAGRSKKRFHPVSGFTAIVWDLSVSIGYMVYRTFGGAVNGETLQMTPLLNIYFMVVHVPVAIIVMTLEILVLFTGFWALCTKKQNRYHRLLTSPLFYIWWFAFLSGEIFYIVMYTL